MNGESKKEIKNKIDQLVKQLKQYEYEYYALEEPTVSDYEYDQLLNQLKKYENSFPEFIRFDSPTKRVGGFISEKFNKVKHKIPMLSLSNAFDENDLIKFDADIKKELGISDIEYVVEPKIDGLSISLIYKNKFFYKAITRGDGSIGEDVTENVKTIRTIPLTIDYDGELEIRGEIFLDKESFQKINNDPNTVKKFANARNAASGSLRNLDTTVTASRNLKGFFYYVPENEKINLSKQFDILKWLDSQKILRSKDIVKCKDIFEVLDRVKYLTKNRNNFDYDIDGIVIKVNNVSFYEELGYTSKFPKWAIAYKFPANVKESTLKSIDVTVGRTGRINFIANIDPIELDGSVISKATLHNAEYIYEKDIRINDVVQIYKAGDIIPKILGSKLENRDENSAKWIKPTHCPSCNSLLKQFENEVDQYCINKNCHEKIIQQITHFCSRDAMNIDGVSESIIRKLYENNLIKDISDIYLLKDKKEEILSKDLLIKDKSFNNIIKAIEKSKQNSLEKLIFGLGIKHVGYTAARLLCRRFKTLQNIAQLTKDEIQEVAEIGDKMAESIIEWFSNSSNIELVAKLLSYSINMTYIDEYANVNVKDENLIFMNKSFVITGSFTDNRNTIKNILESVYHAKVSGTITKNTDYLITGKNATQSKVDKANTLKIKIVSEEFWK